MKYLIKLTVAILIPLFSFAQLKMNESEINYNNYDNKYYYKGEPFNGIMKSGNYELTFKDGVVNGEINGYNNYGVNTHKLNYINGHFNGSFFTPIFKGTFDNDILVGKLNIQADNDYYEYDLNCSDISNGYSYKYHNGKIDSKGILYCNKDRPLHKSWELGISIENFLKGRELSYHIEINLFGPEKMHHLTTYYSEVGKVRTAQIYQNDSLSGEISYDMNMKIIDSISYLNPLSLTDAIKALQENTLGDELFKLTKNRFYISYSPNGKILKKNTIKFKTPVESDLSVSEMETININEEEKYNEDGILQFKRNYNQLGQLDGELIVNYENGDLRLKGFMENDTIKFPIFFYRTNNKLRFSIYKQDTGEWVFEERLPDGYLKIKKVLTTEDLLVAPERLHQRLQINNTEIEFELINEDDDLIKIIFEKPETFIDG